MGGKVSFDEMNSLEEYTSFAATIVDLLRDGEELATIENIKSAVREAQQVHKEERLQFAGEISRLVAQLERVEQQAQRSESKEAFEAKFEGSSKEHQLALRNISSLQEARLLVQQQINEIKQSPTLKARRAQLAQLQKAQELSE